MKNETGLLQDDPEQKTRVKGYERNPPRLGVLRGFIERLLVHLEDKGHPD